MNKCFHHNSPYRFIYLALLFILCNHSSMAQNFNFEYVPIKADSISNTVQLGNMIRYSKKLYDIYGERDNYTAKIFSKQVDRTRDEEVQTRSTSNCYARDTFYKYDINHDGFTDIIADGSFSLVLLNKNDTGFIIYPFAWCSDRKIGTRLDTIMSTNPFLLRVKKYHYTDNNEIDSQYITLTYALRTLIEYNPQPGNIAFDSIRLQMVGGFGSHEMYNISIYNNGTTKCDQYDFTRKKTRKFKAVIPGKDLKRFLELLNYMNPDSLKDDYSVVSTDMQSADIFIYYNNKKKNINDYGRGGTHGLIALYAIVQKWHDTLDWVETKK